MHPRLTICVLALLAAAACGGAAGSGTGPSTSASGPTSDTSASASGPTDAASVAPAPTPETGAPPWPAPDDPLAKTRQAGLTAEPKEFFGIHLHAHLDVFVNGEPVVIPAGIGIDTTNPAVRQGPVTGGTGYGGIKLCDKPCISPLHTHDFTGILHTEAAENQTNSLGQFFIEWGVQLDATCVGGFCEPEAPIHVFVDGEPYTGDPADIALEDHREIAIVIGTFPAEIPSEYDFSNA